MEEESPRPGWSVKVSRMALKTSNPIRGLIEDLRLEPNPDKPMIALSIGDPTTFGNLQPPEEAVEAVAQALKSSNFHGYPPSVGYFEARDAIAKFSSSSVRTVDPQDVIICSGCSGALDACISCLADDGDNILVPSPGFSIYRTEAESLGIHVHPYNLKPDKNWEVDLEDLESRVDERTRALIILNPSNPCGSVYSKEHLEDILAVAERNKIPVIADEIYEKLVFAGNKFYSMADLTDKVPIFICNGLTKGFLVPGWRLGWIIVQDKRNLLGKTFKDSLGRLLSRNTSGPCSLVQAALPAILSSTPDEFFQGTATTLKRHAELVFGMLRCVPGLNPRMPQGAMYMLVEILLEEFPTIGSDLMFVQRLLNEESVFCLPSQCFGIQGFVRLVLTVPEDKLREACERVAAFCRRHHRRHHHPLTHPQDTLL